MPAINDVLTARVHSLLYESLAMAGFLCLGNRESIKFTPYETSYEPFDSSERIYRRIK